MGDRSSSKGDRNTFKTEILCDLNNYNSGCAFCVGTSYMVDDDCQLGCRCR